MEDKAEKVTSQDSQVTNEPDEGSLSIMTKQSIISILPSSKPSSSKDFQAKKAKLPLPPPSNLNYLADLYWKYPAVHQEFYAYPLHTNHAIVAAARLKGERLKQELEKEPEKHRLSKEDPPIHVKGYKPPKPKNHENHALSLAPPKRRTVNQSTVDMHNKKRSVNNVRRSLAKGTRKQTRTSEAGDALAEFRKAQGFADETRSSRSGILVDDQTPVILDAIREQEQEEDVEQQKISSTWAKKCCHPLKQCIGSYRCKCFAFVVVVAIIIILCIVAVIFPVVKVLVYQHQHGHGH